MAKRKGFTAQVEIPIPDDIPSQHHDAYMVLRRRELALRTTLRGSLRAIGDDWQGDNFGGDLADGAQITTTLDEEGVTITHAEAQLGRVNAAIDAIRDGTYSKCISCGVTIPKARLNALPFATHCVKCQEKEERRR
ncbi:MAG: TraR/DksA family transcriptional regulator [Candidatus Peribacteraceae bacterium]|nr:TraR/DksA family transcriptional regulator [Candidatus Peribacteraceae bacterium]